MRTAAKKDNIKMNEYGLFKNGKLIKCTDEKDIFNFFSMEWIPPELRENYGEIEAARNGTLPKLIEEKDLRGIFHIHTTYSDGNADIEHICSHLQKMGFEYAGISDHSKTAAYAGGLKDEDIDRYLEEIERLNRNYSDFKIFKGIESDILPDGNLDYSDQILSRFDFVIAAIHSNFNFNEEQMTARIIRAKDFINSDAHNIKNLYGYLFGINIARKGWLEKEDVPNTLTVKEIEIYLKNKKNKK